MFVTLTPHPTRLSAIAAVAITANTIFFFIIMEQDTPSIAVRLRWGGMRFLEKTKIQHFLLASFQYLADLYPCSRMANNLNFGNCYGLTFSIDWNQKSCAFIMAPACNVCFTFETHSVV